MKQKEILLSDIMGKRNKRYIPKKRFNPAAQAIKIDKINKDIDRYTAVMDTLNKSFDNHIYFLGNFARHDLKNAIQSMDSVLYNTEPKDFDEAKILVLQTNLQAIRETMENFAKLVPYSTNGKFTIDALVIAVELLSRVEMDKNSIKTHFDFPRNSTQEIELPFQALFQVMNNLLINSIKGLEDCEVKKINFIATLNEKTVEFKIQDTGKLITDDFRDKVFEYGYSTTGGSGIGLYHARYLCDCFKGTISLELTPKEEFNKTFIICLPTKLEYGEEHTNN